MTEDITILHYLVRVGVCDDGHVNGCMTYLDWREAYYAPHAAKTSRAGAVPSNGDRMDDKGSKYLMLTGKMGKEKSTLVYNANIVKPINEDDKTTRIVLFDHRHFWQDLFNLLGRKIYEVNEEFACAHKDSVIR